METGAKTDIVSLRPKFAEAKKEAAENKARERHELNAKAQNTVLIDSDAGRRVWDELSRLLQDRIEALIKDDPLANSYKQMIDTLGIKYNQAQMAVKAMQEKYTNDG